MSQTRLLKDYESWQKLAEKLNRVEEVTRHNQGDEKEAWTLAHAFSDLEQSFNNVLEDKLPTLVNQDLDPMATASLLFEIGEELRHILYHIRDPKFYRYLSAER